MDRVGKWFHFSLENFCLFLESVIKGKRGLALSRTFLEGQSGLQTLEVSMVQLMGGHKGFVCPPKAHAQPCPPSGPASSQQVWGDGIQVPAQNPFPLPSIREAPKHFHLPGSWFPMFPQTLSAKALSTPPKVLDGGLQVATWSPGHTKAANSSLCEWWRQPWPWTPWG